MIASGAVSSLRMSPSVALSTMYTRAARSDSAPVLLVDAGDDGDHHREPDRERDEADAELAKHSPIVRADYG